MRYFRRAALALGVAAGLASGGWSRDASAAPDPATDLGLPVNVAAAMRGIDGERIRAHVRFLADDLLEGRGTGARGGDIAARYLATQFALDGLKPAGDDGSYFQKVNFTGAQTLPATTFAFRPAAGGSPVPLKLRDDYVVGNHTGTEAVDLDAPIVFAGYGIE